MNDMHLDPASDEPSCQPEPVAPGLVGQHHPPDRLPGLDRLTAPTLDQPQERRRVGLQLLHWLALDPGHVPGNQPTLCPHLKDSDIMLGITRRPSTTASIP